MKMQTGLISLLWMISLLLATPPQSQWLALQGSLYQSNGVRYLDGSYASCFRLYASQTGGSSLWEECGRLTVKNGFYQTWLGDVESLPLQSGLTFWVEIEIDQETLPDRMALTGSPFAWQSLTVSDSILPSTHMGNHVAVRSINGLQNDIVLQGDSSLHITTNGDTMHWSVNWNPLKFAKDSLGDMLQTLTTVVDSTRQIMGFHSNELREQAERLASSGQSGILSAQDFATFMGKGDLHKDSLKVLRILPTVPYDLTPLCDRMSDGSLYYRKQWGSEESGHLMLCRYNGVYKVYAWENLL